MAETMIGSQRVSSFMISDILKFDSQQNRCDHYSDSDTDGSNKNMLISRQSSNPLMNFSDNCLINSHINMSLHYSEIQNVGCEGPSLDTIALQHYLLRQRVLMRAKPRKGGQIRFSSEQSVCLETHFCRQKYLSPSERKGIATELGLSERQIKTWFQNRRAKWRRCKQFNECDEGDSRDCHDCHDRHDHHDKMVLCNKHKDMHSCSRDNDNDDHCHHCDRYHPFASDGSLHWHRSHQSLHRTGDQQTRPDSRPTV